MTNVVPFKPAQNRKSAPQPTAPITDDRLLRISSSDPQYNHLPTPPAPILMDGHVWMYKYDAEGFKLDPDGEDVLRLIYYISTDKGKSYEIILAQPERFQLHKFEKTGNNKFMAIATSLHDAITILYALEFNPEPINAK